MSINQNFPEIRPSLNLNFARSKILDPRITFTRASTATYVGADGLINTAVADESRFDYDPSTGESLGLLIEESRTNLVTYSEQFDQSVWVKTRTSIIPNVTTAPDGTLTADKLVENSLSNNVYQILQGVSGGNNTYTGSVYVKQDESDRHFYIEVGNCRAGINLIDGSVYFGPNTFASGWSNPQLSVDDAGDGWYKVRMSGDADATITTFNLKMHVATLTGGAGGIIYDGDGSSGVYLWGAQLEAGSFPTSYIPTTSSTVTRAADIASIEGSEFTKTNLLEYSERFEQSAWAKAGTVSVVPNSALSPDGLMTADQITLGAQNARIGQFNLITTTGQTGTASVYLKNIDHVGALTLRTGLSGGITYNFNLSLTNEWVRYELTTTHNGTQNVEFHIRETDATPSGSFLMWGAQLEEGSTATKYTPSVESFVSRASAGTYVGSDGLIKTSPVNLLRYSEQFDQNTWIKDSGVTINSNVETAPDGNLTADGLTRTGTNVYMYSSASVAGTLTLSCWVKVASGTATFFMQSFSGTDLGQVSPTKTATTEWQRFEFTVSTTVPSNFYPCLGAANTTFYIWGAQLEEGSTATDYIPTTSTIGGAPRFDHDPVTLESLGLLIEESRTNELIFSSTLDGYGTSNIASTTQNAGIAPDGTNTAVLAETITTGIDSHLRENTLQVVNTTYTYSFFAKPGTVDYAVVYNIAKNGVGLTWFNVANGTIGTTASGVTPFIKPAGNGWYRVGVTLTTDSTITNNLVDIRWGLADGVNNPTTGENVYVWGAQLEAGSFPTSYIPTSGSTVTRAADVSTSATGVDSWYNTDESTVYFEGNVIAGATGQYALWGIQSGQDRINGIQMTRRSTQGSRFNHYDSGSVADIDLNGPQWSDNSYRKLSAAIGQSSASFADSGSLVGTDNSYQLPSASDGLDSLHLGWAYGGGLSSYNVHIKHLAYYQTRLSDDKLKSITISNPNRYPYMQSIVYNITNSGGTFILRSFGTVNYSVSWNNYEGYEASTSNTLSHTYSAGNYVVRVYSDGVYRPYFNNVTADASQITSVVIGSEVDLGTDLTGAWRGASNITTFTCPSSVTNSITIFSNTWMNCSSLTSFPFLDMSSGTTFDSAWRNCFNLADFPANMFDTTGTLNGASFLNSWISCDLTAQSIENILVSLDTNGASNVNLNINGGTNAAKTTWSTAANTAYDNLFAKGWTIYFNA